MVHVPAVVQTSSVQAMPSSQSPKAQQARQPTPGQQRVPLPHPVTVQVPEIHLPLKHGSVLGQSLSVVHCEVWTHPWAGLQV
jgi:hypothetical protein